MQQLLEPGRVAPRQQARLVVPPLRETVHRVCDAQVADPQESRESPRPNHYFWEWLDSLKAVRYL